MDLNRMHSLAKRLDELLVEVKNKVYGIQIEIHGREDLDAFASAFRLNGIWNEVEDIQIGLAENGKYAAAPDLQCFRNPRTSQTTAAYMHGRAYGRFLAAYKLCLNEEKWTVSEPSALMQVFAETVNVSPRYWNVLVVWTDKALAVQGFNPSGMALAFLALRQNSAVDFLDENQAAVQKAAWRSRLLDVESEELNILEAMGRLHRPLSCGLQYGNGFCRAVEMKGKKGRSRDAISSLMRKGFLTAFELNGMPALMLTKTGKTAANLLVATSDCVLGRK